MKTIFFVLALFFTLTSFAQTSVISVKSHQGNLNSLPTAADHFGAIEKPRIYETIIKIDAHCVVQIGWQNSESNQFRDTVCNHWYYEQHHYSEEKVKEFHGKKTVLIGFEKKTNSINQQDRPFGGRTQRQSGTFLFIVLTLLGLGTFISLPRKKNTH